LFDMSQSHVHVVLSTVLQPAVLLCGCSYIICPSLQLHLRCKGVRGYSTAPTPCKSDQLAYTNDG
jgi:hypothetical protein